MAKRADAVRAKFLERQVGKTESVLIESEIKDGMMQGYTMNYTPVTLPAVKGLLCTVQEVVITASARFAMAAQRSVFTELAARRKGAALHRSGGCHNRSFR